MDDPLDNPVWHALNGPLSRFAEKGSGGRAVRFTPKVSIFSAVEQMDAAAWEAQAELVGEGGAVFFFRDRVPPVPAGWTEFFRGPTYQMLAGELPPPSDLSLTVLGDTDVDEMIALTQLTVPGPFLERTHELGFYVGVRQKGKLVAMAGERFRVPGWTEISAVCTHPDVQRQGLGAALTLAVAHQIRARGDEAFLHLVETNVTAKRLYESLGFRVRRMVDVVGAVFGEAQS